MRIDILSQNIKHVDVDKRAHIAYELQFSNDENNPIENAAVQVFEGNELVYDTDTNIDGVANIELILDIIKETRKVLDFAIGIERRTKVFLLELGDEKVVEVVSRMKTARQDRLQMCDRFFPELCVGISKEINRYILTGRDVLIDEHGELLCSRSFTSIGDFMSSGFAIAKWGNKYFLINKNGEQVSKSFDLITTCELPNCLFVMEDKKYALFEVQSHGLGHCLIESVDEFESIPKHTYPQSAWTGVVKCKRRGLWYLINAQFETSKGFKSISDFTSEGFAVGCYDVGRNFIVHISGQVLIDPKPRLQGGGFAFSWNAIYDTWRNTNNNQGFEEIILNREPVNIPSSFDRNRVLAKLEIGKVMRSLSQKNDRLSEKPSNTISEIIEKSKLKGAGETAPLSGFLVSEPIVELKIGRSLPCPCGGGKEFKNCHGKECLK